MNIVCGILCISTKDKVKLFSPGILYLINNIDINQHVGSEDKLEHEGG